MTDSDIIIEVSRRKLSKHVLYSSETKVIGSVEAFSTTNQLQYRSKTRTIVNGVTFSVPQLPNFASVTLLLSSVNGPVTTFIGSCQLPNSVCTPSTDLDDDPTEKTFSVLNNNQDKVGKVRCLVYVQDRFHKGSQKPKHRRRRTGGPAIREAPERREIPQGFRFRKMDRGINWDRIRNLNMERVVMNSDTAILMSCIDDIALGNLEDEDVDPRLHHAMQLAQYSTQYLLGCQTLLNQRKTVIGEATKCFEKEEAELDMQIAKLRARNSALSREDDDLRDLQQQYTTLMEDICPGFSEEVRAEQKWKQQQKLSQQQKLKEVEEEEEQQRHQHHHEKQKQQPQSLHQERNPRQLQKHISSDDEDAYAKNDLGAWDSERVDRDPWRSTTSAAPLPVAASRQHPSAAPEGQRQPQTTETTEPPVAWSDAGVREETVSQKPPVLRRSVSKEVMVSGPAVSTTAAPAPAPSSSSSTSTSHTGPDMPPSGRSPSHWGQQPKTVLNFGHTAEFNMDKTAGMNMSVDSLMGSNNFIGGIAAHITTTSIDHKPATTTSDEISPEPGSYGAPAFNSSTMPEFTSRAASSGIRDEVQGSSLFRTQHSAPDVASTTAAKPTALVALSTAAAPTRGLSSLSGVAASTVGEMAAEGRSTAVKRSNSNDSASSASVTALNRTASYNNMKRRDISVEVINDHDDLFEHSGSMIDASFLSLVEDSSRHDHNEETETALDKAKGNDEDIHDFSFMSDVGELSVQDGTAIAPAKSIVKEAVPITTNTTLPITTVENDLELLDASLLSFTEDVAREDSSKNDNNVVKTSPPKLTVSTDRGLPPGGDNDEDKDEYEDEYNDEMDFSPPQSQGRTGVSGNVGGKGPEMSPSVTIHMHRNDEDEDQDDVLLGTTRFTGTYTSGGTESSLNDTDEFQMTGGGGDARDGGGGSVSADLSLRSGGGDDHEDTAEFEVDPDDDYHDGNLRKDAHRPKSGDAVERLSSNDDSQFSNEDPEHSGGEDHEEASGDSKAAAANPIHWLSGRAPIDLVETANALDVFVSAIRFDSSDVAKIAKVCLLNEHVFYLTGMVVMKCGVCLLHRCTYNSSF